MLFRHRVGRNDDANSFADGQRKKNMSFYLTHSGLHMHLIQIWYSSHRVLVGVRRLWRQGEMSGAGNAVTSIGTRMVFIVLTDFSCWIPIIIIGIASLLGMEASPTVYAWIAVFVLPLNSALNPILYTISTANFRRKLRGTIRKRSRKTGGYVTEHSLLDSKSANSGLTNGKSKLLNGNTQESDL